MKRPFHAPSAVLLLLMAVAGCAGLGISNPVGVNAERKKRDAESERRLTERKDFAEFQAALNCWNQQDVKGCRERLERLLARNPKHRDARLLMADVLLADKRPKEALAQVQDMLKAHPDDADVQYATALLLDSSGRGAEAMPYYERAAELAPDNEVYSIGCRTARGASAGKAKVTTTRKAGHDGTADRAEKPSGADVRKAGAALAKDTPETVPAGLRKAADPQPHDPQAVISAAAAALQSNQPKTVVDLLEPAVAKGHASGLSSSAAAHRILGTAYYRLGEFRSSQTALQQALSLDKSSAPSYFLLGCTLKKLGQADAADVNFRKAEALDPRYALR